MEVLLGLAGGAAAEILQWFRLRKELHRGVPDWARHWLYWIITFVMVGFGGLLVFIYQASNVEISPIIAFNIGASAPLILETLIGQVPQTEPDTVD